jgi:hypothetical protein
VGYFLQVAFLSFTLHSPSIIFLVLLPWKN